MPEKKLEQEVENTESKGFMKRAFDLGYNLAVAGAATALGVATMGITAPIVGGALAGGVFLGKLIKGGQSLDEIVNDSLRTYSVLNAILYPVDLFGTLTYPFIPNITPVGKVLRTLYAMFAHTPVFLGAFRATDHMVKNKFNPKGIYKSVTENFIEDYLRTAMIFAPGWALASNGITTLPMMGYSVPTFAVNAPVVSYCNQVYPLGAAEKTQEKSQPSLNPAIQPAGGY